MSFKTVAKPRKPSVYSRIIEAAILRRYVPGAQSVLFTRSDLEDVAGAMGLKVKNLGDIPYAFRYRQDLPGSLMALAPAGRIWIIKGVGSGLYELKAVSQPPIQPRSDLSADRLVDCSDPLVRRHRTDDEQAMLALAQDNDLLSRFLGGRVRRIQSHLRTRVEGIGQIEIDDLYVGQDDSGREIVVPVQAKKGADRQGTAQTIQDVAACATRYPNLICRPVSIHYDPKARRIALLELACDDDVVSVEREEHWVLSNS